MSNKRKRIDLLSDEERLEIINWLNTSTSFAVVAREFGISENQVRRINQEDKELLQSETGESCSHKRRNLYQKKILLEESLILWYRQRRALNEKVTGAIIKETAVNMSDTWPELDKFNGNIGWFARFKSRYGIRSKWSVRNVKSVWNLQEYQEFQTNLSEMKKEHDVEDHQVYNATEIEIYWRMLPNKLGKKVYDEKVTVMVCSNATGTHKVPLFIIGDEKNPKCFENIEKLPVYYAGQKDALMDGEFLLYWYENIFLPSIREYQSETQKEETVLLIMDTAPFRPLQTEFNSLDSLSRVEYLPRNIPSIIQPMSCGITKKLRMNYKELFLNSLSQAKNELIVEAMVENYSLVDFCLLIASAWETVPEENIRLAWSKNPLDFDLLQDKLVCDRGHLLTILQKVPGYDNTFMDGLISWIRKESIRPGWKVMTNDEIVKFVSMNRKF